MTKEDNSAVVIKTQDYNQNDVGSIPSKYAWLLHKNQWDLLSRVKQVELSFQCMCTDQYLYVNMYQLILDQKIRTTWPFLVNQTHIAQTM